MENELENIDSTNDELENIDSTNEEEVVEDVEVEEKEEYSEREKQLYARLKKAEADLKDKKEEKTEKKEAVKSDSKLSTFDMLALQKANIETEDDLDEVVRWADYNKISVAEALKSNILKATLNEKAEERQSALAVNTGTGRRASGTVTDARLMADAQKGIMPESAEDIAKLARMRIGKK
jgi:hypothetical protein